MVQFVTVVLYVMSSVWCVYMDVVMSASPRVLSESGIHGHTVDNSPSCEQRVLVARPYNGDQANEWRHYLSLEPPCLYISHYNSLWSSIQG